MSLLCFDILILMSVSDIDRTPTLMYLRIMSLH